MATPTHYSLPEIVIVSGLPRSGTSMMMAMLQAGGMAVLTDAIRVADESNPEGYFEFEAVKQPQTYQHWLPQAVGKAVKVVSTLLDNLPANFFYRVIFMRRPLDHVLVSQHDMLARTNLGQPAPEALLRAQYEKHLCHADRFIAGRPNMARIDVAYGDAVAHPRETAERLSDFLGGRLDATRAAAVARMDLNRSASAAAGGRR